MNKILVTTGDPNGIGAEIAIKALNEMNLSEENVAIVSNRKVLDFYGKLKNDYEIIEVPFEGEIEVGKITKSGGEFSFRQLETACQLNPKAIVTAPVAKEALHLAGYKFNGQTEVLQKFLAHDGQKAEMLFAAGDFRVLLLTRHCALKDVNLTREEIVEKVLRTVEFLKSKGRAKRFALCALNPHAGEGGVLGREEIEVMLPAVEILRGEGVDITLPKPADTLFYEGAQAYLKGVEMPYDCYFAAYHDQGLIPIKTVAGAKAVNVTIGLDVLRTSPSHGTAFDIAGKNMASAEAMCEAIKFATL